MPRLHFTVRPPDRLKLKVELQVEADEHKLEIEPKRRRLAMAATGSWRPRAEWPLLVVALTDDPAGRLGHFIPYPG